MIDLRVKGLPNAIMVDGRSFLLNTDFRIWLEFSEIIKKKDLTIYDIAFVFTDDISYIDVMGKEIKVFNALIDFYVNKNSTPKNDNSTQDKVLDYIQDGEYIVASFMQSYSIDLTTCDMHWHLFKALLLGLPNDTKIKEIMSMRAWEKDDTKYEEKAKKNKDAWRLPIDDNNDDELLEEINNEFYNC